MRKSSDQEIKREKFDELMKSLHEKEQKDPLPEIESEKLRESTNEEFISFKDLLDKYGI